MRKTIFITDENKNKYKNQYLTWLESDFNKKGPSGFHFWYNASIIATSFDECRAMVVLNNRNNIIGYMTWNLLSDALAVIDIVEVKKNYRRKGIFKEMLSEFSKKFTDVVILLVLSIPEAQHIFENAGWTKTVSNFYADAIHFFKIIKPVAKLSHELPDGCAIAFFSKIDLPNSTHKIDYYHVQENPSLYSKQYCQLDFKPSDLTTEGTLNTPIVLPFHYEGYIGIYMDKILIAEGKAKHLFENKSYACHAGVLVIHQLKPTKDFLLNFTESRFFLNPINAITDLKEDSDQPLKRRRTEINTAHFFKIVSAFAPRTPDQGASHIIGHGV